MLTVVLVSLSLPPLWQPVRPGVWQSELRMAERGALSAVRVVAVRVDPARVRFALDSATTEYGTRGAWTVDRLPSQGAVALNTGQFIGGVPWGWVVHEGVETSVPGTGSVAMTFAVDSAGTPALLAPDEVAGARGHVRLAFQSYPMLLRDDELPVELQAPGRGVDLDHRDSRLAIGLLRDGTVVIALTRMAAPGAAATLPWGPTVPEMAAFMKSLGCHRAVLLDGGISSQMALRRPDGSTQRWTNWRKVPLGLVVTTLPDSARPLR
jgi:uncharacterized protein YigE (DUF2233 family)